MGLKTCLKRDIDDPVVRIAQQKRRPFQSTRPHVACHGFSGCRRKQPLEMMLGHPGGPRQRRDPPRRSQIGFDLTANRRDPQ
jgi:hypothetical protein